MRHPIDLNLFRERFTCVLVALDDPDTEDLGGIVQFMSNVLGDLQLQLEIAEMHLKDSKVVTLPIDHLLQIQKDAWSALELIWMGMNDEQKRAFEDYLAPWWAEVKPKLQRSYELAKKQLEEHQRPKGMVQ
jgi:hypothetical protein